MLRSIDYSPFLLTVINRDLMLIKVNRFSLRAEEKISRLHISFPFYRAVKLSSTRKSVTREIFRIFMLQVYLKYFHIYALCRVQTTWFHH